MVGCVCTNRIIFFNTEQIHVKFATNILCGTATNTVENLHFLNNHSVHFVQNSVLNDHRNTLIVPRVCLPVQTINVLSF